MAEIRPFRAWRYNQELSKNIGSCLSPLFDVVTDAHRRALYSNPVNSIHLSVPKGESKAENAAKTLKEWKSSKIIEQDFLPGIYPYYQYFNLPGSQQTYCRKGFICLIRAYDWEEKVVLRHENTIPPAVHERVELLKATELNASATHGLFSDPDFQLEEIMDECITSPILETEDYQGVREVLTVVHDSKAIKKFIDLLEGQQVILADGHHRYQGSIDYRKYRTALNPDHTGNEGYNFHMMFLTNMEAHDLRILATHRLVKGMNPISSEEFIQKADEDFHINKVETPLDINNIILGKKATFGVVLQDRTYMIKLKDGRARNITWPFPNIIKELDLTILHFFILEKVWGIKGPKQRSSSNIVYDRNYTDCLNQVENGEAQMAIITNEITMQEVKQVCFSGYTLPQKSTYFYPKVVCGLLFGSIKEDEFQLSDYPGF